MQDNNLQFFKFWKPEDVERIFEVSVNKKSTALKEWLAADTPITEEEKEQLEFLRIRLLDNVQDWNEAALKFYFLEPLMSLIWFKDDQYSSFLEIS
jgi:hypothetical protein